MIQRPADGDQYVHGRWLMMHGETESGAAAIGVVNSGQHGLDCKDGVVTLSVLRSAAYCHEQGQPLDEVEGTNFMDQGIHDFRVLVTTGSPDEVRSRLSALADWLDVAPVAYTHLNPISPQRQTENATGQSLLELTPSTVQMTACKQSSDGCSLIVRVHETQGVVTSAILSLQTQSNSIEVTLRPFEIKTLRIERDGSFSEVDMIEET